jgi:hypothetical protein
VASKELGIKALDLYLSEAEERRCTIATFLSQFRKGLEKELELEITAGRVAEVPSARGATTHKRRKSE